LTYLIIDITSSRGTVTSRMSYCSAKERALGYSVSNATKTLYWFSVNWNFRPIE